MAVPIKNDYQKAYLELEKVHAAIKNIRTFNQLNNGNGEQGRKCSLCGERNAYFYNSEKKTAFISDKAIAVTSKELNINEALCTVCMTKRFYPNSSFPSTAEIALKGIISDSQIKEMGNDPQLFYEESLTEEYFKKNKIDKPLKEVKELRRSILKENNLQQSDLQKYYAIIMFDGDNMGKLLSGSNLKNGVDLENFHKHLSVTLERNAKQATKIVNKVGKTVYAGGDDFLGFVSLNSLLKTLKSLNETFSNEVSNNLKSFVKDEVTMSAGIVIAHYKMPLHIVLNWARKMEQDAKKEGNRNAFAIAVLKHSGEIHKTVYGWKNNKEYNIENMHNIIKSLTEKHFSTNFIYTLEEELSKLYYSGNTIYNKQFQTELKRLIHKSNIMLKNENEKTEDFSDRKKSYEELLYKRCKDFYNNSIIKRNYFSLMKIIAFIYHQLGGEK